MQSSWSYSTIIIYVATVVFASIFAFAAYKKRLIINDNGIQYTNVKIKKFPMVLSFLVLWMLPAFSTCGADYDSYNSLFLNSHNWVFITQHHHLEIGFAVFQWLIYLFTDNINIYRFILSFAFLFPIYLTLIKQKEKIHFGWAVLVLSTTFYLQFMNLTRIYLAAAICLFGLNYLIDKNFLRYLACIVIAISFHTSAVVMLIPFVVLYLRHRSIKINKMAYVIIAIFSVALIYMFRYQIVSLVFIDRYEGYGVLETRVGILQALYHIPIFFFLGKKIKYSESFWIDNIAYIFLICSFAFSFLGYFIQTIGRTFVFFMFSFMLAATTSTEAKQSKNIIFNVNRRGGSFRISWWSLACLLYFAFRFFMYCNTSLYSDALMPYINIFNIAF